MDIVSSRNVGQVFTWGVMGNEAVHAVQDLRWMIVLCIVLIVADFRFGRAESKKLYKKQKRRGMKQCAVNYNKAFQDLCNLDEFSPYCEFVDTATQFDTLYNMPMVQKNVNIRNSSVKEYIGTNGVHPTNSGYFQIADAVYRNFVANYCQG